MLYAYEVRGLAFVLTLNAENGQRSLTRQSDYYKGGVRERSFGLCQLMEKYHANFIRKTGYHMVGPERGKYFIVDQAAAEAGGFTDAFLDYKKQVDYCASVRDDAIEKGRLESTFYGYNVRKEKNNGFYIY